MSKTETGLWVIVFFIAIVFFILICQRSKKSARGGGGSGYTDFDVWGFTGRQGRPYPDVPLRDHTAAATIQQHWRRQRFPPLPPSRRLTTVIFVQPLDRPAIPVDVPTDATTEDLVRQVQVQLGRRVKSLEFSGVRLEPGALLADQGITPEAQVREINARGAIIRLNTQYNITGPRATRSHVFFTIFGPGASGLGDSLKIPLNCIASPAIDAPVTRQENIELKPECDISEISLTSANVSFDPNLISNIIFGNPDISMSQGRRYTRYTALSIN